MEITRYIGLWFLLFFGILAATLAHPSDEKLRAVYSWTALDFAYPDERSRQAAIAAGEFIPGAPVPIDVDVYTGGSKGPVVFMTIPRFQNGVPVTLGYVTNAKNAAGNPIIAPYPNWAWQRSGGTCSGITSVYRMQIDRCGRLWVLDTGKLVENQVCPPQLLVFSLGQNQQLLSRYVFPRDQYVETSLFVTPAVDIRGSSCQDTYVYIADVTGFSLIVYDHRNNRSWKITNNLFYPYPPQGTFSINNESFDLMDGILGLALGPVRPDGDRILYFHSLASQMESWVPTSTIRNMSIFNGQPDGAARSFRTFDNPRTSQSAAQAMDKDGVLFFGLMTDTAIGCWNSRDFPEFGGRNVEKIAAHRETLQFPSGMKIVTSSAGRQEFWVITVSFQKVMTGSINPSETNFRIQAAFVDELVRGTKCDVVALGVKNSHRHNVNRQIPNDNYYQNSYYRK